MPRSSEQAAAEHHRLTPLDVRGHGPKGQQDGVEGALAEIAGEEGVQLSRARGMHPPETPLATPASPSSPLGGSFVERTPVCTDGPQAADDRAHRRPGDDINRKASALSVVSTPA